VEDLPEVPAGAEAAMIYFDRVKDWFSRLEAHIGQDNGFQTYCPTCVIEPRYIWPILERIQNDGLAVQA
jgi:hypothetical protein